MTFITERACFNRTTYRKFEFKSSRRTRPELQRIAATYFQFKILLILYLQSTLPFQLLLSASHALTEGQVLLRYSRTTGKYLLRRPDFPLRGLFQSSMLRQQLPHTTLEI